MMRNAKTALALCVVMLGTAIEARADCKYIRGGIAETLIPSNDPIGRLLGTVTGVLNGASTVFITSPPPNVTSYDVFVTTAGDVLIATGVSAPRTPVPGFYLCGAATHPAGSVIALNGRNAADAVLADLGKI